MSWKKFERRIIKVIILSYVLIMVFGVFLFMIGTHGVDIAYNMKALGADAIDIRSDFTVKNSMETYIYSLNQIHIGLAVMLFGSIGFTYYFFFLLDKRGYK